MQAQLFTVKYVTVQNCFVYLPDTWQRRSTTKPNILKIRHKDRDLYFSWLPRPSPDDFVGLSATFAGALGIQEGDDVHVSCEAYPPSVANVVVVPRCSQDWEIVELQSNKIQESLLHQINVVAVNQQIVVWISKFLSVVLRVESMEPGYKYGKLEPFTEITVSLPKAEKADNNDNHKNGGEKSSHGKIWDLLTNLMPKTLSAVSNEGNAERVVESVEETLKNHSKINLVQTFRILPIKGGITEEMDSMSIGDSLLRQPYNVFMQKRFFPNNFHVFRSSSTNELYCRIKKVRQNMQFVKVTNTNFLRSAGNVGFNLSTDIVARLFLLEDILEKCSYHIDKEYFIDNSVHPSIYVSKNLRHNLKLKIGAKVMLEPMEYLQQPITSMEICPQKNPVLYQDLEKYFEKHSKYNKVLINSSSELFVSNERSCFVKIIPDTTSYALIDSYDLRNITIRVKDALPNLQNDTENLENPETISLQTVSVRGLKAVLSECESVLRLSLGLDDTLDFQYDRENILISGKVGSGKTTVCQILSKTFHAVPNFVYLHMVDCKALKGKKIETLHKTFLPAILDCVYHQPAILFLDDLDSIAGKVLDEEENTPDAINIARTADMLLNLITEYQAVHYFTVVATCTNIGKVSQKLAAPRGIHLFRTILSIPDLEKKDRIELLQLILKSKSNLSSEINWNHYGNKTDGWMPQDLVNFADKAIFNAWKRHVKSGSKDNLILCDDDLGQSFDNCIPMSLQGINLYSGPGHAWSDIGGLAEIKQSLIELLHWPLRYPELFKNAPIRHQGGVLLYGAPGTGKTMLAGAIAKECGLNFISVKGPELLSKYIGASEEAVRNVFEKANSAKPCVLFFDEFDSLAPRRGHDSTGVTDRVVNQFLAQLDGVEGRQGVAVVAASSRPDLLDPALLRPGRLDKVLLCPLPNEEDREEILAALCRSQKLDTSSLDLKTLATGTPGFTGADLNAIISQARLTALEESMNNLKAHGQKNTGSQIIASVNQGNLIDAMNSTKPSLSAKEMLKYDRIYTKFSGVGDSSDDILKNSQRATLA